MNAVNDRKSALSMNDSQKKLILLVFFALFLVANAFLVIVHEPWRDEIHAWLLAKNLSIPELIENSRVEGHPRLWHFILMPFAKLGAPIWTIHVISYLCVAFSAYLFLFKTKVSAAFKVVVLFTIPFLYTFSSISRNYCLILLLGMLICVLYDKRYERPILYSVLISLMVFTHVLAWGLVAGFTITFHITEIVLKIAGRSKIEKKTFSKILIGFALIVISTLVAVFSIAGYDNPEVTAEKTTHSNMVVLFLACLIVATIVLTVLSKFKIWKEAVVFILSMAFKIYVYAFVYSGVLFQRIILIYVYMLFFILLLKASGVEFSKVTKAVIVIAFFAAFFFNSSLIETYTLITHDIIWNYSSGKEMAEYINENLPDESVILVDGSTYAQALLIYTDKEIYDISRECDFSEAILEATDYKVIAQSLTNEENYDKYQGKYLVAYYLFRDLPYEEVYRTSGSIMAEDYILYRIP